MTKPNIRDFYDTLGYDKWTRDEFTANHISNIKEYLRRVERDFTEGDVDDTTIKYVTMAIDQASSLIKDLLDIKAEAE